MRTVREIAAEIEADPSWRTVSNKAAKKALGYMKTMGSIRESLVADPNGYSVVGMFLAHTIGWRGKIARRVKLELREMSGHPRP
jgi:hypothetical protein